MPNSWAWRGVAYERMGNRQMAQESFQRALGHRQRQHGGAAGQFEAVTRRELFVKSRSFRGRESGTRNPDALTGPKEALASSTPSVVLWLWGSGFASRPGMTERYGAVRSSELHTTFVMIVT